MKKNEKHRSKNTGILQNKKKEFLANLILLAAATILCIAVIEITLRITWEKPGYGYPAGLHIPDETKGFRYQPNFEGKFPSKEFGNITIKINSLGLRDIEHNYTKGSAKRIVGIGDSVTFGAGTTLEDTFLKQLEKKMHEQGIDSEVINAGVNSYEFEQEYLYYKEEIYKYNPDILIIGIVLNDAGKQDIKQIREARFGAGSLSFQNIKELIRNNCYICNFIYFQGAVLINRMQNKGSDYNDQYFQDVYSLWNAESWDYTEKQMDDLVNTAEQKGTKVILVIFPYTQQFSSSKLKWGNEPQQTIKEYAKKRNLTAIDLLPVLDTVDYQSNYLPLDNVHLNPKGNEIVSEEILKTITAIN